MYLLSDLDDRMVNALQASGRRGRAEVDREGFGLTRERGVVEGPSRRRRSGRGHHLQIRDGVDGYLVDSAEEAADRTVELLADADRAARMGGSGRRRVEENLRFDAAA